VRLSPIATLQQPLLSQRRKNAYYNENCERFLHESASVASNRSIGGVGESLLSIGASGGAVEGSERGPDGIGSSSGATQTDMKPLNASTGLRAAAEEEYHSALTVYWDYLNAVLNEKGSAMRIPTTTGGGGSNGINSQQQHASNSVSKSSLSPTRSFSPSMSFSSLSTTTATTMSPNALPHVANANGVSGLKLPFTVMLPFVFEFDKKYGFVLFD
jgi:hypothetical protein